MKIHNNELADRLINALESFLTLDETIKYFHQIESDLKNAILHCPTESDKKLFKSCLRSAKYARSCAESAMRHLEKHGCLEMRVINPIEDSIKQFRKKHYLVRKRSYEIVELLENNEIK